MANLAFSELLPDKPGWLEQDEYEERTSVGFQLGRLVKRVGELPTRGVRGRRTTGCRRGVIQGFGHCPTIWVETSPALTSRSSGGELTNLRGLQLRALLPARRPKRADDYFVVVERVVEDSRPSLLR